MARGFITKRGLNKLKEELRELLDKKRPDVAGRLKDAASFGDLSENAEYAEAKEAQAFVEGRILEIEGTLRTAVLVSPKSGKSVSEIRIGCTIRLLSGGKRKQVIVVGKSEGNPLKNEISSDSPMGKALLGKKFGDVIFVSTPIGRKQFKIIKIA